MTDVGAQQRSLLSKTCQDPANGEKQLNYATPQKIEKQIHTKQVLDYSSPSDLALQSIYLSIYIIDYIYNIYITICSTGRNHARMDCSGGREGDPPGPNWALGLAGIPH